MCSPSDTTHRHAVLARYVSHFNNEWIVCSIQITYMTSSMANLFVSYEMQWIESWFNPFHSILSGKFPFTALELLAPSSTSPKLTSSWATLVLIKPQTVDLGTAQFQRWQLVLNKSDHCFKKVFNCYLARNSRIHQERLQNISMAVLINLGIKATWYA